MTRGPAAGERGAVTAELAMVVPLLVSLAVGLVWLLAVGADQVRTVDAARETARALARGESADDAVALGERIAPAGARVSVADEGEQVRVTVTADLTGPGGVLRALPGVQLSADAVAVREPS